MFLDRAALVEGLTELGVLAAAASKIIDLAVYVGSCLILVSNFRSASQDVDAVASPGRSPVLKRPDTLIEVVEATRVSEALWSPAIAGFLDTFYMNPDRRQAMIDPEPPMTGNTLRDAAAAEHLARRWDLRIPAWTANPARTLHEPHFAGGIEELKPLLLAQSPLAFCKRMIFVEHEPLSRARMPRN